MRCRSMRQVVTLCALTGVLLLAMPASALAADSRGEDRGGVWTLAWERLAAFWDEAWDAVAGMVPGRGAKPAKTPAARVAPTEAAPLPPPVGYPPPPQINGDNGGGIDPNGG